MFWRESVSPRCSLGSSAYKFMVLNNYEGTHNIILCNTLVIVVVVVVIVDIIVDVILLLLLLHGLPNTAPPSAPTECCSSRRGREPPLICANLRRRVLDGGSWLPSILVGEPHPAHQVLDGAIPNTLLEDVLDLVFLFMQSVLIIYCFICKVSLLFSALYAKCPYYLVLYMQSVLVI